MDDKRRFTKIVFAIAVSALIIMNLYTLIAAYPETCALDPGISTSGTILQKISQLTTLAPGDYGITQPTSTILELSMKASPSFFHTRKDTNTYLPFC